MAIEAKRFEFGNLMSDMIRSNLSPLNPELFQAINESRQREIEQIEQALAENHIVLITGSGRFGKTALSRFLLSENHLSKAKLKRDVAWVPSGGFLYIDTGGATLEDFLPGSNKNLSVCRVCLDEALTLGPLSITPVIGTIINQAQKIQGFSKIELIFNGVVGSEADFKRVVKTFPDNVKFTRVNLRPYLMI